CVHRRLGPGAAAPGRHRSGAGPGGSGVPTEGMRSAVPGAVAARNSAGEEGATGGAVRRRRWRGGGDVSGSVSTGTVDRPARGGYCPLGAGGSVTVASRRGGRGGGEPARTLGKPAVTCGDVEGVEAIWHRRPTWHML